MKVLLEIHDLKRYITIILNNKSNEFIEDIAKEVILQLDWLNLIEDKLDDKDNDNTKNEDDEFN